MTSVRSVFKSGKPAYKYEAILKKKTDLEEKQARAASTKRLKKEDDRFRKA